MADQISAIEGLEFVDQDEEGVIVALASDTAAAAFEEKLSALMKDQEAKEAQILYALQTIEEWSTEDRKGPRLKNEPLPVGKFFVDVELWSHDNNQVEIKKMKAAFESWLQEQNIEIIDHLILLPYYRLEVEKSQLDLLLQHRDVRLVDLLAKYGIEPYDLSTDVEKFDDVTPPSDTAGKLAILDTGITSNHPFIGPALADAQSFITSEDPEDNHGHGTWVAGIGLYGDVKAGIDLKSFTPKIWVLSGRVLDENSEYERKIILNSVTEAVDYFLENYGCRIYNLSFGDSNYPYKGGRLQAFALGLDQISRAKDVLFVVSAGNFNIYNLNDDHEYKDLYPAYLLEEDAKIIDPSSAVNVVTVGSISEYDRPPHDDQDKIRWQPIAQRFLPSPFTRSGPSIKGAIKPDFVDFGGNYSYNPSSKNHLHTKQLGQVTLNKEFLSDGKLFTLQNGTSFAAPRVAHLAARLHSLLPEVKTNTIRAILASHADYPLSEDQKTQLISQLFDDENKGHLCQLYGYGKVDENWLFSSGDESVTIYAEDAISDDENHFYEIPLPDDFITGKQRFRKYSVALAHSPSVRHSRLDYTATRIRFRLKYASSIDEIASIFSDKESAIKMGEDTVGNNFHKIGPQGRDRCTLQTSQFLFKGNPSKLSSQKLYLAVIRQDRHWAKGGADVLLEEPYSLVLNFQDREAENADLYNSIQNLLAAREQAQIQKRIRTKT